jgi:hypothetical protein
VAVWGGVFHFANGESFVLDSLLPTRVIHVLVRVQQDFPFNIRIPESIPPSIALEKGGEPTFADREIALLI